MVLLVCGQTYHPAVAIPVEKRKVCQTCYCFLAASCRITGPSGLEYILTRKCPLP